MTHIHYCDYCKEQIKEELCVMYRIQVPYTNFYINNILCPIFCKHCDNNNNSINKIMKKFLHEFGTTTDYIIDDIKKMPSIQTKISSELNSIINVENEKVKELINLTSNIDLWFYLFKIIFNIINNQNDNEISILINEGLLIFE